MNDNQFYLNEFYKTKLEEYSEEIKNYKKVIEFENNIKEKNQPVELAANFLFPISLSLYLILFISINIFFNTLFIFSLISFILSFPFWALATIVILIFYEKSICNIFNPVFMKKVKPYFMKKLKPDFVSNKCYYNMFDTGFKYYVNYIVPSRIIIDEKNYNNLFMKLNFSNEEIDKILHLKKFSLNNNQPNISLLEFKQLMNMVGNYKLEYFTKLYDI